MGCHICDRLLLSINIRLHDTKAYSLLDLKRYRPAKSASQMWENGIITFSCKSSAHMKRHSGVGAGRIPVSLYSSLYSMICRWLTIQKMCWCVLPHLWCVWSIQLAFCGIWCTSSTTAAAAAVLCQCLQWTCSATALLRTHKCFDRAHSLTHNYVLLHISG